MKKLLSGFLGISMAVFLKMQLTEHFEFPTMASRRHSRRSLSTASTIATKWQPKSHAISCPNKAATLNRTIFKSQGKEDFELFKWFGKLCNGTYMEMGALDGVTFSNTHAFHYGLDWKGLLLEASPKNYERLVQNRPNELALVHAGVCAEASDLHWIEGKWDATSGFLEFATDAHKQNFFTGGRLEQAQIVRCQPLRDTIKEQLGENVYFDFYSLDIEGAEFAALESLDFDKVSFGMILVEADGQNPVKDMAVKTLLESKGYRYMPTTQEHTRFGSLWFMNKDWHNIYKDLIYAS
ncbi:expressed unknown protein [Seminavis robusta]|uniref:Methyltransferase FkbM domain-containing protein n=1 Tax=Seminavis robusta TaxID=568900 RepID=A0A9N8EJT1_9STRA|nr:expressed unknown protein [Seminavis robusta]|eukprot:Sro1072_g238050.1 n/a (295) ;mRNA; r:9749-10633